LYYVLCISDPWLPPTSCSKAIKRSRDDAIQRKREERKKFESDLSYLDPLAPCKKA
jgi:hypothetical protein